MSRMSYSNRPTAEKLVATCLRALLMPSVDSVSSKILCSIFGNTETSLKLPGVINYGFYLLTQLLSSSPGDLNGRNNLGDSDYTTYLENPTTITNALKSVGATEMIKMGEADAQEIGENSQENAIAKWKKELMIPLAKAVAAANSDSCKDDIQEMQKSAIPILVKIDPDYTPPKEFGGRSAGAIPMHLLAVAVIMALVAALFVTGTLEVP